MPAGTHLARIYSFIHLGTALEETKWGPKESNKARITWELPTVRKEFKEGEGEKPYSISQDYTLYMSEKANLRKMVESILGKKFPSEDAAFEFDVESLVGMPCFLQIVHKEASNGNTYANIANVMSLPKGTECPAQENASFILNYDDVNFKEKFNKLPQFIKDKMSRTYEFKNKQNSDTEITPDDVPF